MSFDSNPSFSIGELIYLGGRYCPYFEVIGPHEEIGDTGPHHANDPLIEIFGFGVGYPRLERSVDHAVHAPNLLLLWQHRDVVLKGVRNPEILASHVRDALMSVPVLRLG